MSSSSDEDIPLAGLIKKKRKNGKVKEEENGEEEEEPTNGKRRRSKVNYAENDDGEEEEEEEEEKGDDDDDDDDSDAEGGEEGESSDEVDEESEEDDDDIPLAALKAATPPKKKKKKAASKPAAAKKKKAAAAKKKPKAASITKTSSSSSNDYPTPSAALYGSGCQKGELIQKLLCRWWYAIPWPDPASIPAKPPANYDPLDGIPGVYVCTSGDDVGQIKDFRDKGQCPSFLNFAKKPSEELQELLIKALEEQKASLIKVEGAGTPTEKDLNNELKWAKRVNPSKADKEAAKLMKANKMDDIL